MLTEKEHQRVVVAATVLQQLLQQRRLRFGIVAVQCFPLAANAHVTRMQEGISERKLHLMTLRAWSSLGSWEHRVKKQRLSARKAAGNTLVIGLLQRSIVLACGLLSILHHVSHLKSVTERGDACVWD